jgi:alkanesulfonate monooxygenase SsuD/methylene tetrahydromethanopterin reductase-like flavin-dependent oxidoreductase (luciferase family)
MGLRISFKTSPQRVDWATLDATWALAGRMGGWDGAWMNDHLTDMVADNPGASLEALTTVATLVHHVPGLRIGHAVLSNTFRHPVITAMGATVLDHATRGNFVLGLGAGWFEGEHEPFGIELPEIGPRIDRLVASVETLRALFSPEAAAAPGVTRDDPHYPLRGAVCAPPPRTPGGPPLYLGGQGPRGIRLAARTAAGWLLPGTHAGNIPYFAGKRDELVAALEAEGRDAADFDVVGQVSTGATRATRREAVAASRGLIAAGATHIILGMPAALGPAGLDEVARDCLAPLRDATA